MPQGFERRKSANYGINAPNVMGGFVLTGVAAGVLAGILYRALRRTRPGFAKATMGLGVFSALFNFGWAALLLWGSKVGNLRLRDRLVDSIPWRGDENVLHVGCGRGLLLVGAAKRLTTGRAIGVDIWREDTQSGNRPEATWKNERIEGVEDRIEVRDGDARHPPFANNSFDVVMSSFMLHHIADKAERQKATGEMVRVLNPSGRLAISDVWGVGDYVPVLNEQGLIDVVEAKAVVRVFPSIRIVSGRKPMARSSGTTHPNAGE